MTTYFESSLSSEVAMQTIDGDHGRIETRTLRVSDELDWLEKEHSWVGLKSILAVTRHIALNLKVGVKTKRLMASWDNEYLLKIIGLKKVENIYEALEIVLLSKVSYDGKQ